ncbi:MAG: nickel-dependent hydrogenase large subunit [Dehalococcoides mccartyi]|uniref:nickel-dependent hydrogenase large subunit n=1 Tax=Dehalococcoides TaxID=61434 RepID=UPI001A07FE97|nr:nickel-dependent hydrogenase large subunit [Dehalococcoides mccartyi]MBF4483123.1 nickel-dependent hydrogenase large subunit [Dehalococcoides mccartyi]MBJ7531450.1 nickel-dependent hydrogenase large subunit [Dehalococcoides mccartyi]MDP4279381.1 nickel-dependent hydrogenase large subunit [Dehalococcoides mccartyi]
MQKIVIDPITRIEGHLKIEATVDGGEVKDAKCVGTLFRGFEIFMKDRDPRDAVHITQRICGVCPTSHGTTAALNLDSAFGVADKIPNNGRILRNLIQGANYIASHIVHFYHLAALDYVDVTEVADYDGTDPELLKVKDFIARALAAGDMSMLAPFYPRYEGDYRLPKKVAQAAVAHYVEGLNMRRLAHEMSAIYSGRLPHSVAVVAGGVTSHPSIDSISNFMSKLNTLRNFIDNVYIPDVIAVAESYPDYFGIGVGCGNLLSYGVFDLEASGTNLATRQRLFTQGVVSASDLAHRTFDPSKITESIKYSWFKGDTTEYPLNEVTEPEFTKADGYSWLKAPRYDGTPYEVGPLARMVVNYVSGDPLVQQMVNDTLDHFGAKPAALFSTLGRHAARALECKIVADEMVKWLMELKIGEPVIADYEIPETAEGMGLWEAPRGALGHWIKIENHKISNYQCVVPTTWNCSPKDNQGVYGPVEQALIGTKVRDNDNPFELVRIVRSFDPCLACAVHLVSPTGNEISRFRVY